MRWIGVFLFETVREKGNCTSLALREYIQSAIVLSPKLQFYVEDGYLGTQAPAFQ